MDTTTPTILTKVLNFLKTLPVWVRHFLVTLAAIGALVALCITTVSCSTFRISQTSTGEIKVTSSNSVMDSTKINIHLKGK